MGEEEFIGRVDISVIETQVDVIDIPVALERVPDEASCFLGRCIPRQ